MAGSFGIGLGSFLSGAVQGAQAYAGIQDARSRNKLNDLRVKEAEGDLAEKTHNQDIQAEVDRIGQIGLQGAQQEYGDDVKKVLDHYYTKTIPQQQQHLIGAGKVEAADALGKFMETKQAKQLTEFSALAIKQASMGDYTNLGPTIENLLGTSAQVTGGTAYKFKGMTELTDDKGAKTGAVSFKFADGNGKDQDISFNNSNELIGFIRNNAMPDKIVEYAYQQEQDAKKIRAETAKEKTKWEQKIAEKGLDFKFDVALEETKGAQRLVEQKNASGLRIQEQTNQAQLNSAYGLGGGANNPVAKAEATIEFLRKNGVPEEFIQQNLPAIAGIENKSRPMASRIDDYVKMRSNADLKFGQMTPEQQIAEARKYIAAVDQHNGSASSGTTDNPFQGGGASTPATQGGKGLTPYYDTQAGKIIYR